MYACSARCRYADDDVNILHVNSFANLKLTIIKLFVSAVSCTSVLDVAGLRTVGQLAAYWNLPVFSWFSGDAQFDDVPTFPTLVRMKPSLAIMGGCGHFVCKR